MINARPLTFAQQTALPAKTTLRTDGRLWSACPYAGPMRVLCAITGVPVERVCEKLDRVGGRRQVALQRNDVLGGRPLHFRPQVGVCRLHHIDLAGWTVRLPGVRGRARQRHGVVVIEALKDLERL